MNLSIPAGLYNTGSITSSTNIRDVSAMLDMWAHENTPLLNRIEWGAESGGLIIEWVHEHLGWFYVVNSGAIASNATKFKIASGSGSGLSQAEQTKQIRAGALLYCYAGEGTASGGHVWMAVSTVKSSYSITVAFLANVTGSVAASSSIYVVGNFAQEGSEPGADPSRKRTLLSNKMTILRKDIRITGSQQSTDMYAVANELTHQTKLRLMEMQVERERSIMFGRGQARADGTAIGYMQGAFELLLAQSAQTYVDDSTTSLTETIFNNVYADCVDNGFSPNVAVGSVSQIRKFTAWDRDRVRTTVDQRLGGKYINQYLTDTGKTVDLIAMQKFPANSLFVLSTDMMKLRAKKGRKLLLNKLGLKGDYQEWQMVSEYSLEMRSTANGAHAGWTVLT